MEILQEIWRQNLRARAVMRYNVKIFLPSPPNYVTRSPGEGILTPEKGTKSFGIFEKQTPGVNGLMRT